MKLLRYGPPGEERPGLLGNNQRIHDLTEVVDDIGGDTLTEAGLSAIRGVVPDELPIVESKHRLGPCVSGVGKLIGIGLNYVDHAAEAGMPIPEEPILFMKATSSICGPDDPIRIPEGSEKLDWEAELGVVIGTDGKNILESDAMAHVAGYCVVNDVSERMFQLEREGQWVKGKSCDSFGPIGPYLVTRDEVPDSQNLDIWLDVNGHRRQDGNTRTMIFSVAALISYVSQFMSLQPGDIISTGTPPGVGHGTTPPVYLNEGDRVVLSVQGMGVQSHIVVADR